MRMKIRRNEGYNWKFSKVGGVTRVNIESGDDIAHLGELDQKLWTVLSCPVQGLELDEDTLRMMDTDADGKIRVKEVTAAAAWLCGVLRDPGFLLRQTDRLPLSEINSGSEEGARLLRTARQILDSQGRADEILSLADTSGALALFAKTPFNGDGVITPASVDDETLRGALKDCIAVMGAVPDRSGDDGADAARIEAFYAALSAYVAWLDEGEAAGARPFGEATEAVYNAYNALDGKARDFFMRCKLAAFDESSAAALDMSAARVEAISGQDLTACAEQIAACPLARVSAAVGLPRGVRGVNPAWQPAYAVLCREALGAGGAESDPVTEAEWTALGERLAAYGAWRSGKKGAEVEPLGAARVRDLLKADGKSALLGLVERDKALSGEADAIQAVNKLLHLTRDFYTLLKNFVTLSDFYSADRTVKADFQAGTLYIDQRGCDLCIKVSDMAKHNAMAHYSGMYLLYCDCVSKVKNAKMTIVAVMTGGDVAELTEGKNAVFYDRSGQDWDATVVKIVDNPISIRQAFWAPYRKIARFVENQISNFASTSDEKVSGEAMSKISEAGGKLTTEAASGQKPAAPQAFDIAKFCGIFAAIGMALGMIGSALVAVVKGFLGLTWWQMPLSLLAILLLISAPSMIMAWLKLRKRSLSPLLNANGWAVNSSALVNIRFGAMLTRCAQFPHVIAKDPFADKNTPWWRKALYVLALLAALAAGLYFTGHLGWLGLPYGEQNGQPAVEEVAVSAPAEAEPAVAE